MPVQNPIPGTQKASSTGGTIIYTKTGLIHNSGKQYGGDKSDKQ